MLPLLRWCAQRYVALEVALQQQGGGSDEPTASTAAGSAAGVSQAPAAQQQQCEAWQGAAEALQACLQEFAFTASLWPYYITALRAAAASFLPILFEVVQAAASAGHWALASSVTKVLQECSTGSSAAGPSGCQPVALACSLLASLLRSQAPAAAPAAEPAAGASDLLSVMRDPYSSMVGVLKDSAALHCEGPVRAAEQAAASGAIQALSQQLAAVQQRGQLEAAPCRRIVSVLALLRLAGGSEAVGPARQEGQCRAAPGGIPLPLVERLLQLLQVGARAGVANGPVR